MAPQKPCVLGQLSHWDKKTTFNAAGLCRDVYFLHSPTKLSFLSEAYQRKAQTFLDKHQKKSYQKLSLQINVVQTQRVLLRAPSSACKGSRTRSASWIESWDFCPCTHSSSQTLSGAPQFLSLQGWLPPVPPAQDRSWC